MLSPGVGVRYRGDPLEDLLAGPELTTILGLDALVVRGLAYLHLTGDSRWSSRTPIRDTAGLRHALRGRFTEVCDRPDFTVSVDLTPAARLFGGVA